MSRTINAKKTEQILQQAINEELLKKSKLGQYAIIEKDGKPCRILASELIKDIPQPNRANNR